MKHFRKFVSCSLGLTMALTSVSTTVLSVAAYDTDEHISLSRKAAAEGMVLLENNNNALPIANDANVAVFGRAMIDYTRGGGGSGATNVEYSRNILEGLQMKEEEGKISLYQPLVDFYKEQVTTNGITNDANITVSDELISGAADSCSTAVITLGRYSSEGSDRSASKGDYYLSDAEEALITRVAAAFDKTVVVLNIGAVMDTSWIEAIDGVDAVLCAYQAGMEGGLATADVLVGDVNPSGKTVDTWASDYSDYPSSDTFYENSSYVNYEEDIFVGYRYFETFDPTYDKVNYEFGYGLSYTTFSISDVTVSEEGEDFVVSAVVTNTGNTAGKEVVQTYFAAPRGDLDKPAKELAAFAKTDELDPGESETVTMTFAIDDMSSYDDTGVIHKSAYVMEAGNYDLFVGNSIKDAGARGSVYTWSLAEDKVTEELSEQCSPTDLPRRLKEDGSWQLVNQKSEEELTYAIPAEGTTKVEMEDFIDSSGDVRVESYYDSNNNRQKVLAYLQSRGRYAEYALDVEEAGKYEVIFSYANGYADNVNPFTLTVDGVIQNGISFTAKQTGDGSGNSEWYNFKEGDPVYINLPAGEVRLRLMANNQNPNYDYMLIRKVGDYESPYVKVDASTGAVLEADLYTGVGGTSSNYVRKESYTDANGDSKVCIAYLNYPGNYVSWLVDVEEAGEYDIIMNVANGRASYEFDPGISVNDTEYPATITAIQTGDGSGKSEWYNFDDLAPVTVTLPEGQSKITFTCSVQDKYPNIGEVKIVPHTEDDDENSFFSYGGTFSLANPSSAGTVEAQAVTYPDETELAEIQLADVKEDPTLMDAFVAQISDDELIAMLGGQSSTGYANTGGMGNNWKYGIPNAMTADGPQGIRISKNCTAWPVSTCLASSWDEDLIYEVGKAAAVEAKENGIDIWLAPGMNIHRDPLCGRNFEYYSEDPLVAGKMAAAITRGCQSENVSITLKHFAANNKETNRNSSDSRMTERALREIYLKGFEIAVKEGDPWSIMTSYNYINGIETSENYDLLTNIARGEWGYEGIFMTDWGNNSNHVRELLAGNDVKMPTGSPSVLSAALEAGTITRADLEAAAKRLFNMIMKTCAMDKESDAPQVVIIEEDTYFKAADNIYASQTAKGETTSDEDGGRNLGYCDAGAWTEYKIDVHKGGYYTMTPRVASNAGSGAFTVSIDGEVIATVTAEYTGGWQSWKTLESQTVKLPEGRHVLRLDFTQSGSNVNWLRFEKQAIPQTEARTALQEVVDTWDNADLSAFTEESAAALREAIDAAKALLEDEDATDEQLQAALIALSEAIAGLEFIPNTTALEAAIEAAEQLLEHSDDYKDTSGVVYALGTAKTLLESGNYTQKQVNDAFNALIDAISALELKVDCSALEELVEAALKIIENEDSFTSGSLEDLKAAIRNANDVIGDPKRTEDDVNKAYKELADAIASLKLSANKEALKAAIYKAEGVLNASNLYVDSTLEGLSEELAAAKAVLADDEADQETVDEATVSLTLQLAKVRLLGDVNNDGNVDTSDARMVLQAVAELGELSDAQKEAADVNRDGKASTADAAKILQYSAEMITNFD